METIPLDCLYEVACYLPIRDLLKGFGLVCRRWHQLLGRDQLWASLFRRDYNTMGVGVGVSANKQSYKAYHTSPGWLGKPDTPLMCRQMYPHRPWSVQTDRSMYGMGQHFMELTMASDAQGIHLHRFGVVDANDPTHFQYLTFVPDQKACTTIGLLLDLTLCHLFVYHNGELTDDKFLGNTDIQRIEWHFWINAQFTWIRINPVQRYPLMEHNEDRSAGTHSQSAPPERSPP